MSASEEKGLASGTGGDGVCARTLTVIRSAQKILNSAAIRDLPGRGDYTTDRDEIPLDYGLERRIIPPTGQLRFEGDFSTSLCRPRRGRGGLGVACCGFTRAS